MNAFQKANLLNSIRRDLEALELPHKEVGRLCADIIQTDFENGGEVVDQEYADQYARDRGLIPEDHKGMVFITDGSGALIEVRTDNISREEFLKILDEGDRHFSMDQKTWDRLKKNVFENGGTVIRCHRTYIHGPHKKCAGMTASDYSWLEETSMSDTYDGSDGQPMPIKTSGPSMHDLVREDLLERKAFGLKKYGTILQANNGRDALQDLYDEMMDALVYIRQLLAERESPAKSPEEQLEGLRQARWYLDREIERVLRSQQL